MNNVDYIQRRQNSRKQWLRIRLGVLQMIYKPLFHLFLLPIIAGTIFLWVKKDIAFTLFDVPQILFPIYKYSVLLIMVLLPVIFTLAVIEAIGNMTAKKDEQNLAEAFDNHDLRNGCPILMNKKRIKGSNVTMREFYSSGIPMKVWVEKQENIADVMNVHFVEPFRYGGKSNGRRIVMYTAPGRETVLKGILYDDEF
jgi:predicted membrane protein